MPLPKIDATLLPQLPEQAGIYGSHGHDNSAPQPTSAIFDILEGILDRF